MDQEGVESEAAGRGRDARGEYVELEAVEGGREGREQSVHVRANHEDLGDGPIRRTPHRSERSGGTIPLCETASLPGDLIGLVAQEGVLWEIAPQPLGLLGGNARIPQQLEGLAPALRAALGSGEREATAAADEEPSAVVESRQQLTLPVVPELGVRGGNVGDREQVEIIEAIAMTHARGETRDHFGILDVLTLRGARHEQVCAHQPSHQLGIGGAKAQAPGKGVRVLRAEFGVVSPALWRCREQRPEVEKFRTLDLRRHRLRQGASARPPRPEKVIQFCAGRRACADRPCRRGTGRTAFAP